MQTKAHYYLITILVFITSIGFSQKSILKGLVSDEFGPLPGARLDIEGNETNTKTDVNGFYQLEIDPGEYTISASFIMYGALSHEVTLKVGDTTFLDFNMQSTNAIDEESSLGSRGRKLSLLDASLPVTIITPDQIANSGQMELGQILHYLSPTFNSTHQTIADGTDHIDPATMRGLGTDQVLVLVNGKRRHVSSLLNVNGTLGRGSVGTDFNAIPTSSVERIEFLTDGAAAIFGSDAIAGVINIVLKKETGILNVNNRAGINTTGDGFNSISGINTGFDIGNKGYINLTGEYKQKDATNRAGNFTGNVYSNDDAIDEALIIENNFFGQTGYDDQQVMEIGHASTRDLSLFFNSEIELSQQASFYAFGGTNFREGIGKGFYRLPVNENRLVDELNPNGFSPEILSGIQDNSLTLGILGATKKWLVDFSNSYGSNQFDLTVRNSNNASLGILSPSTFFAGGFFYRQNSTNLDFTREYDFLEGTNISFGGELRIENYRITPGETASWVDGGVFQIIDSDTVFGQAGSQVFPGFQPDNQLTRFRTNQSAYFDLETNITKEFLLRGALRYESYNDFKGQPVWKLSGRYKVAKLYSIRVGAATGYRAPSLHQIYFNNISTQFIGNESIEVGTFNNVSRVSDAFNITTLKPELSTHFNLGFTGKISESLNFNFEVYTTEISDRIVLSGRFDEGYEEILDPLGVGAAQFLTNAIDTRTNGVDFSVFCKSNLGVGVLTVTLNGNFTQTKIIGLSNNIDTTTINADDLFNREERSRIESIQPSSKIILTLNYEIKKWAIGINNTRFGRVDYIHPLDGDQDNWILNEYSGDIETRDQSFNPKIITDLSIGFRYSNNVKAFFKVNNVLNIYPDKHTHSGNTSDGSFEYSRRVQQFGLKGTNILLGLNLKL